MKEKNTEFINIPKNLIYSNAFISLTNAARIAYILILSQRAGGKDIKFPYSSASIYLDRHTYSNSLKSLSNKGFITIKQKGGQYRKTNTFDLSNNWQKEGFLNQAKNLNWSEKYHAYLKSEKWLLKKDKKLKQADNKCQLCNRPECLNVHHRTYDRIFHERDNDLIVLCKICHAKFHDI